jgi:hypothetical protein
MSIILNVMSREMDPVEMSFDKYLLQREAWRFLEKTGRPPSCESLLKFRAPSCILIGYLKTIANGAHSSVSGLFSITFSCWQRRYEQILSLFPMAQ